MHNVYNATLAAVRYEQLLGYTGLYAAWSWIARHLSLLSSPTQWAKKVSCCILGCNFVNYAPI